MSKEKKKSHWGWLVVVFLFSVMAIDTFNRKNEVSQEAKVESKQPVIAESLYAISSDKSNPPYNRLMIELAQLNYLLLVQLLKLVVKTK